jgi:hypothetical protein
LGRRKEEEKKGEDLLMTFSHEEAALRKGKMAPSCVLKTWPCLSITGLLKLPHLLFIQALLAQVLWVE